MLKIENENRYLKIEIKKLEDIIESNKKYIDKLNRETALSQSNNVASNTDERIDQLEKRLKEIFQNENDENKKVIQEKNEKIEELLLTNKSLENNLEIFSQEFEKLNGKSYEFSIGEIQKRDDIINYLETEYDRSKKGFYEEQKIISNLFHRLGYEYACVVADKLNLKNE